jgi:WD40 repeat protein
MSSVPLAVRVVEVIADRGDGCSPRYRCGSGIIVAGRTVLTAAHVVTGAVNVVVRGPDKVALQATADPAFTGDPDGPGPDLALVEVIGGRLDVPAIGLAAVARDSPAGDPVERCHVIGYPAFMERETAGGGRFRETADALGQVPVLSGLAGGLLSVQVSSSPRPLPPARAGLADSPWSGMSGSPVIADGLLLGIVTEHAPRAGSSAITATPLTALDPDPEHPGWGPGVADPPAWWARLGVAGPGALTRLPAAPGRGEPAYWATVQEIRKRTGTLNGRQDELAAIAAFAAGEDGYLWLVGDAWAGKTSLLAEAATALPGNVDVVCYFMSRREADADSWRFLAAVVPQLAAVLDEDTPAADLQHFRALWHRAAESVGGSRHLVLVVDGLDEDLRPPGLPSVASLLPAVAGGHVHVLVSSRPHPDLPSDIPAGHPLLAARPAPVRPFSGARELALLARQEIDDLLARDDDGLATDVLGLLTAAAGPLAARDLAALTIASPPSAVRLRRIRRLLTTSAARSLQASHLPGGGRYQFAHESLLAYAQANGDLSDPDFRRRIHQWAAEWRAAGWPTPAGEDDSGDSGTPRYLLDTYPSTLAGDPRRLADLVGDAGWLEAAVVSAGVDPVLAGLHSAVAASPAVTGVAAMLAAVTGQAQNLRAPQPVGQPGYILRQLWMQAAELGEGGLADRIRDRLTSRAGPGLVPRWTTRRVRRALAAELGRHDGRAKAVAALPGGRVVSGGHDGRVLVWDPDLPGAGPVELGRHDRRALALAVLPDGRVVSGGGDGQVLVWDPDRPGAAPEELGRHDEPVLTVAVVPGSPARVISGGYDEWLQIWYPGRPGSDESVGRHDRAVSAVAVLPDGRRMVSVGLDQRVLLWDLHRIGLSPVELGRHDGEPEAAAVLPGGRVVVGDHHGGLLVWDPDRPGAAPAELNRDDYSVGAVAVLPDGRVVAGLSNQVLVWDPDRPGAVPEELGSHDLLVEAVAVLPDGRVVSAGGEGRVLVWDPHRPETGPDPLGQYNDSVSQAAVLPDGRVVTAGGDGRMRVWDPDHPETGPAELGRHGFGVDALALLPGGRVVTAGSGRILVWDPDRPGAGPAELGEYRGETLTLAVLPDGRLVSGGTDTQVRVWNTERATPLPGAILGWHDRAVTALAVLPGGQVISAGHEGRVRAWRPEHPGADPAELACHHDWVRAMKVLPDGRVASGGHDGQVLAWHPDRPGTAPRLLARHDDEIYAVAVLPDGRVASGGADRRVVVCDPAAAGVPAIQLDCSVLDLAAPALPAAGFDLVVVHQSNGFSLWSSRQ